MELDINVAMDIQNSIAKASGEASRSSSSTGLRRLSADDSSGVIHRRNERREARKRAEEGLNNT